MWSFSVVIPAYNAEKTIAACLASVASQSLHPLEILIVDDCSSDRTREQVERFVEIFSELGVFFSYTCLRTNSGPSAARNFGISRARGQYIAFLDADDIWHCDKLLIISQALFHSVPGLVFHSYCDRPCTDLIRPVTIEKFRGVALISMLFRNPAQTSCVVVKNERWLSFNTRMRHCEDYDLWLRIADRSEVLQIVSPPLTRLGRPQLTKGGLSSNIWRMRLGEMHAYIGFCRRYPPWRYLLAPILLMFSVLKHFYLLGQRLKVV